MELTDILPIEEWTAMEEELYERYGLNVRVYDINGKHITSHEGMANTLCPVIRSSPDGLMTVCSVAHQNIARQAQKTKNPIMSECDVGMIKFVIPIFQGEEFVGSFGGCGYALEDDELETFLVQKLTSRDTQELEQLASEVKRISEDEANQMMESFNENLNQRLKPSISNPAAAGRPQNPSRSAWDCDPVPAMPSGEYPDT